MAQSGRAGAVTSDVFLFEVKDVFRLPRSGFGLVVVGSLEKPEQTVSVGENLVLLCLNGHIVNAVVKSLPMINFGPANRTTRKGHWCFELSDVPGSEHITPGSLAFRG